MPSKTLHVNWSNTNLMDEVASLKPSPGYCVFIDVVGSTAMKQEGIVQWTGKLMGAFLGAGGWIGKYEPLKGIGDELMYFLEASDLVGDLTPLQLVDQLLELARKPPEGFPSVKVVAAYCTNVYPMSFLANSRDYYGLDIDLTARLKGVKPDLVAGDVVVEKRMYDLARAEYDGIGNKDQFLLPRLTAQQPLHAKGVATPVDFYRANMHAS